MIHKVLIWVMAAAASVALLPAPAMGNLVDAVGDAQDVLGEGPPLLDIDTMFIFYDGDSLYFEVTFHTPISAPSSGQPDGVAGYLTFDTDQSVATGNPPPQNQYSPPFATLVAGIDFGVDLFSEIGHPGFVDVLDANFLVVDTVPISYGPMSFSGSIPLASLGGDDGVLDFTVAIGTSAQATDATDVVGTSEPAHVPVEGITWGGLKSRY